MRGYLISTIEAVNRKWKACSVKTIQICMVTNSLTIAIVKKQPNMKESTNVAITFINKYD